MGQPVARPVAFVQGTRLGTLGHAVCTILVRGARLGTLVCAVYSVLTGACCPQDYPLGTWVLGGWWVACEVALPQGALSRGPRNYPSGTWRSLLRAQYSPTGWAVQRVENCARQDEAILTRLPSLKSGVAVDGLATRLFFTFS